MKKTILLHTLLAITLCVSPALHAIAEKPTEQEMQLLRATSKAFAHIAETSIPAVVSIRVQGTVETQNGPPRLFEDPFSDEFFRQFFGITPESQPKRETPITSQGSGFLVSNDGYILTNNHIVRNANHIRVGLTDGREFEAEVVGTDPKTDLAVVKIEGQDFPYLSLGDSDGLAIGEWVVAIGSPFGLEATLTVGVVSAKGRNQLRITDLEDFIQTDAAINVGNSGGPLLNLNGEVIGINTAIVGRSVDGGWLGVGFAIPSKMAKRVMEQLISTGTVTRGYIGVTLQPVDADIAAAFGLGRPRGALITEVVSDSPAQAAGLEQGDIVVALNEVPIDSIGALRNAISLMKPGTQVTLTVNRDGKLIQKNLEIGLHPQSAAETSVTRQLGIEVTTLTEPLAQQFDLVGEKGIIVSAVEPGSPASRVGLAPGALVVRVNRTPVATPQEFASAVEAAAKEADHILLLVRQGRVMRYVSMKING